MCLGLASACPARAQESPRLGAFSRQIDGFAEPTAAAIAADGTIYVVQRGGHRVSAVAADGRRLREWGGFGDAVGTFRAPEGIAVSPGGEVFVADTGNHRVQVFTPEGGFLRFWGAFGTRPGELNQPRAIAVNAEHVFVADTGNDRVQVFDHSGRLVRVIGGPGDEPGRFLRPAGVAATPGGELFVADADNARVQRFSPGGEPAAHWGAWGSFAGLLAEPLGLSVHEGLVFVADTRNHRVQVFDHAGMAQYQWGLHALRPREGAGRLHYPDHVAVSPDGALAVVCESFEDRIQVFVRGPIEQPLGPMPSLDQVGAAHFGERIDADGALIFLAEPDSQTVLAYTTRLEVPVLVTTLGGYGRRPGQFIRPTDLHYDAASGRLLVLNAGNRRLDEFRVMFEPKGEIGFDPNLGRYVRGIEWSALAERLPERLRGAGFLPAAMESDAEGNLYLLDQSGRRVLVFSPALEFKLALGGTNAAGEPLLRPADLALTSDGRVLVVDELGRKVVSYRRDGGPGEAFFPSAETEARAAATSGERDGTPAARESAASQPGSSLPTAATLLRPVGIGVCANGDVLVADAGADRVLRLSREGRVLWRVGRRGLGTGEFSRPTGAAECENGRVAVVDFGNHRVQILEPDGAFRHAFGARLYVQPTRRRP